MDIFGELNQKSESPYVTIEKNEQIKNEIFARLGKVKKFIYANEDGESLCSAKYFLEVLNEYHFQKNEISKMKKGNIWLSDGDVFVVAKF